MRKVNRLQRLARQEEQSIIKRIVVLSAVSLLIIFIFFTTGIPFLGRFADLMDTVFKKSDQDINSDTQVQAPILDSLPQATNDSNLKITGFSNNASRVELFLDSEKIDEVNVEGGRFSFEDVKLEDGENELKAKAFDSSGKESEFSQTKIIIYDDEEPSVEITSPTDGQDITGNNRVKVEGKTEEDAQVYANGFLANVLTDGKFEVTIPLSEGENQIEVKASDEAGNTEIATIKVNFRK